MVAESRGNPLADACAFVILVTEGDARLSHRDARCIVDDDELKAIAIRGTTALPFNVGLHVCHAACRGNSGYEWDKRILDDGQYEHRVVVAVLPEGHSLPRDGRRCSLPHISRIA